MAPELLRASLPLIGILTFSFAVACGIGLLRENAKKCIRELDDLVEIWGRILYPRNDVPLTIQGAARYRVLYQKYEKWAIHLTQVATRCCGRAKASTKKRIPRLLLWRGVGLRSASDARSCRPKAATAMNSRVGRLGGHSHDSRNLTFLFRSREATTHRVYLNEVDTPLYEIWMGRTRSDTGVSLRYKAQRCADLLRFHGYVCGRLKIWKKNRASRRQ